MAPCHLSAGPRRQPGVEPARALEARGAAAGHACPPRPTAEPAGSRAAGRRLRTRPGFWHRGCVRPLDTLPMPGSRAQRRAAGEQVGGRPERAGRSQEATLSSPGPRPLHSGAGSLGGCSLTADTPREDGGPSTSVGSASIQPTDANNQWVPENSQKHNLSLLHQATVYIVFALCLQLFL